jgi:hypothetical protein
LKPTVLDAGETVDELRSAAISRLRQADRPQSVPDDLALLTANPTIRAGAVPRKLVFGSDFVYAYERDAAPTEGSRVGIWPTLARGGYGVAWGGAMLPADDADMQAWPIRRTDLEAAYRRVLSDLPLSAVEDGLARDFPLFKEDPSPLRLTQQTRELARDLDRVPAQTTHRTLVYGQARLAVRAVGNGIQDGCRYCGLCLAGCVYGSIYNPADDLDGLIRSGRVEYRPGLVAIAVDEIGREVQVTMRPLASPERLVVRFDRLFIAAGPVNTTRIMLESRRDFDCWIDLKDSQKFLIPLVRLRRAPFEWPNSNTLAGLFLEAKLHRLHDHWIHMQISSTNNYVLKRFGIDETTRTWRRFMLMPVVERIMAAWCGLHSDQSDIVRIRLASAKRVDEHLLEIDVVKRGETTQAIRDVAWAMVPVGLRCRTLFLAPLTLAIEPGGASHTGGSFPMRRPPSNRFESDLLGKPAGYSRVHLVDSSIFPSIPGTTMSLLVMANADRIASAVTFDS